MRMNEIKCPNCGKRFVPNWNMRKYCCESCRLEHRKKQRVKFAKERWTE